MTLLTFKASYQQKTLFPLLLLALMDIPYKFVRGYELNIHQKILTI